MAKEYAFSNKIKILGGQKEIDEALKVLKIIPLLKNLGEPEARILIQDAIDEHNLHATVMWDGNSVWSMDKIIGNLKRIIEHEMLYNSAKKMKWLKIGSMIRLPATPADFKPILSDYFYDFLTLCCGSIAHYNKAGWIAIYPTLENLKQFFKRNELGKRVVDYIPDWHSDALRIVEEIEKLLFPFQSFIRAKQKEAQPSRTVLGTRRGR
jgi:hypothetical protein